LGRARPQVAGLARRPAAGPAPAPKPGFWTGSALAPLEGPLADPEPVAGLGSVAALAADYKGLTVLAAAGAGSAGLADPKAPRVAGSVVPAPWGPVAAIRVRPGISEYVRAATSGSLPPVRLNWRTEPNAT